MLYVALLLNFVCIGIVVFVVIQDNMRKSVALFSLRNIFLLGFLYFQSFGFFSWLLDRDSQNWWAFLVTDPDYRTSIEYILMLLTFLVVFLIVNRYRVKPPPPVQPIKSERLKQPVYLARIAVYLIIGSYLAWGIGAFSKPVLWVCTALGATATGFAVQAWTYRLKSLPYVMLVIVIGTFAVLPNFTSFGRRGIVSLALIVAWVFFYRVSFKFNLVKTAIVSVFVLSPVLVALAAYSDIRGQRPASISEGISLLRRANIRRGFEKLCTFQGSAAISMWCMENFPANHEQRPLFTARATVHFFYPRRFWPSKPEGLGSQVPRLANIPGRGALNVGAGLVGHSAAEGGWYAILVYAVLFGFIFRYLDNFIRRYESPVVRIPFACSLGEIFATCRGEISFFLAISIISVTSAMVAVWIARKLP